MIIKSSYNTYGLETHPNEYPKPLTPTVYDNSELPTLCANRNLRLTLDDNLSCRVTHVLSTNAAENGCCMIGPGGLRFPLDLEVEEGEREAIGWVDFATFSAVKKRLLHRNQDI